MWASCHVKPHTLVCAGDVCAKQGKQSCEQSSHRLAEQEHTWAASSMMNDNAATLWVTSRSRSACMLAMHTGTLPAAAQPDATTQPKLRQKQRVRMSLFMITTCGTRPWLLSSIKEHKHVDDESEYLDAGSTQAICALC